MSNSESYDRGTDSDNRDADELARNADDKRERIGRTLNQLEDKLAPERMMDNAMGLFREHGGELADGLQRSVKSNPLPLILTGVGIAWMMMNQREDRQRSSGNYDRYPSFSQPDYDTRYIDSRDSRGGSRSSSPGTIAGAGQYRDDARTYDSEELSGSSYAASSPSLDASSTSSGSTSFTSDASSGSRGLSEVDVDLADSRPVSTSGSHSESHDSSGGRLHQMRQRSGEFGAQAQHRMSAAAGRVGERADEWSSDAAEFMREQPIVAGALGVAFGALLGSLLPTSEKERQLARQAVDSDAGKETLKQADEAMSTAQREADKRIDQASRKADEQVEKAETEAEASA